MKSTMTLLLWACTALALISGCSAQTLFVKPGDVVRLVEDAPAKVAVYDAPTKTWIVRPGKAILPAGGYYIPAATQPSK